MRYLNPRLSYARSSAIAEKPRCGVG